VGTGGLAVSVHSVIVRDGVKLDNCPLTVLELAGNAVAAAERLEEGLGRQNNLEVTGRADPKAKVEQPVSKLDGGRGFNEEHGVKVTGGQSDTSHVGATPEPSLCAVFPLNVNLQLLLTDGFTKTFRSVEFVGVEDIGNRTIPFFRLPAQPLSRGNGRSPTTPLVERPTISDREF
jgi:hypothetical protein